MKYFVFISIFLVTINAQAQQKIKQPGGSLQKMLNESKHQYKKLTDSIYQITFAGDNIKEFDVTISQISDLFVISVDISEAMNLELKPEKYESLLKSNDAYDIVKIGLSEYNNHLYLRADIYSSIVNTAILKRIIAQVANVTEIIAGDLNKKDGH